MEQDKIIKQILRTNKLSEELGVKKFTSGIVNDVFAVGDKYVIKMEREHEWAKGMPSIMQHQPGIIEQLVATGAKVPRVLDAGEIDGINYLLMKQVTGINLVYEWMNFSLKQKENFVAQIAEQLKLFHSITFDEYAIRIASGRNTGKNLRAAIEADTDFGEVNRSELTTDQRDNLEFVEEFYRKHIDELDEINTAALVHNDIHLENIFFEGDTITGIIDFDWVCQAPKDYELWKLVEVMRVPMYTVEEKLEPLYENYRMVNEFEFLKKYYPELFQIENLANRIRLYYLEKYIEVFRNAQKNGWTDRSRQRVQDEAEDIYRSDWLDRLVVV